MTELSSHYRAILNAIGEDVDRSGLHKTPERAAESMRYLTKGYHESLNDILAGAIFEADTDEMVIVKHIELYSLCEHHLLPFIGTCHVAYLPKGKILGLSKIAQIVDHFARRLQVQEILNKQIAETLMNVVQARGVGVIIEAKHLCMMMRGVEKQNAILTTSVMLGAFRRQASTRNEFLSLIKMP